MKCDTCNKEMKFFREGQTCGWKCNSCNNLIVTTYNDEISMDDQIYCISISPGNSTTAKNIKCAAKILNCSFIDAKEFLLHGIDIKALNAIQTHNILKALQSADIQFTTTPEFDHII